MPRDEKKKGHSSTDRNQGSVPRRRFLTTAGIAMSGLATVSIDEAAAQVEQSAGIETGLLPSKDEIWDWQEFMVDPFAYYDDPDKKPPTSPPPHTHASPDYLEHPHRGIRFTGSPADHALVDFLEQELLDAGLETRRSSQNLEFRFHKKWSLDILDDDDSSAIEAASYFPYSGTTPEGGIEAPVEYAGLGTPAEFEARDFEGKIALIEMPIAPLRLGAFYPFIHYQHSPAMKPPSDDYKRAWTSILTPQTLLSLQFANEAGAVGAIMVMDVTDRNAAGQYTSFLTGPQGVPCLHVGRETGEEMRDRIVFGETEARLELAVDVHEDATADELVATLPGQQDDEYIIVNTHNDGTSASEENGTIGMLALAQYFARLPIEERNRTLVFVFSPGHFHYDVDTASYFIENNPEIIENAVASVTVEHLGQMEWNDDRINGYHSTGEPEPGAIFCSQTPVIELAAQAVRREDLTGASVLRPLGATYFGEGPDFHEAGVPNVAFIAGPNHLLSWAENQHLDKTDKDRMYEEIRWFARLITSIDETPAEVLDAGDTAVHGASSPDSAGVDELRSVMQPDQEPFLNIE